MLKSTKQYTCSTCGATTSRWTGKCDSCGSWNTLEETFLSPTGPKNTTSKGGQVLQLVDLKGSPEVVFRLKSNIQELDRTCGGGLVPGSVILVGGDPGIGKSTLLLQTVSKLSQGVNKKGNPTTCFYISGEESIDQVRLRAQRLSLSESSVKLISGTNLRDIIATLENTQNPDVLVIDSIQTMYTDILDSSPGTVGQVRAVANELIRIAKTKNIILFLVGHVTKEGTLAGPRVLEHMVDTVLYFEGDRGHHFRILRSVKNRFGATDEIGVFEMTSQGLQEVSNPSALFLAERQGNISGSCVFAGLEGSRPILVEIQALIAPSSSLPRRTVVGGDTSRLVLILAVLEARFGISLSNKDIFLNIAGGLKIAEPACDLAIVLALLSAYYQKPIPAEMVVFGEIGLSGEIRAVPQQDLRLKEADKLGFTKAFIPINRQKKEMQGNIKKYPVGHLKKIIEYFNQHESV